MPVTLDTRATTRGLPAPPPVDLSDFAHPREAYEGRKALLLWLLLPVVLAGLCWFAPSLFGTLLAWWALASWLYLWVVPRSLLGRLRKTPEARITAKNAPRLHAILTRSPSLLGIRAVQGFLVEDEVPQARIGGPPHFFLTSTGARDLLAPPEWDCLALRALIHARQGHARRLMLLRSLADTPPIARLLAWPISLYAALLGVAWEDCAAHTADRLTLLLVKDRAVLLSAAIKLHAATDPLMQDAGISAEDVDSYVKLAGNLTTSGREISTHYKLGSAIADNPYLGGRIEALMKWSRSPEYTSALEKLSGAKPAPGTKAPAASSAPVT